MTTASTRRRRAGFAALLMAGTALSGVAVGWQARPAFAEGSGTPPAVAAPIDTARTPAQALPGFADLVQRVRPAVVTVTTTARPQQQQQQQEEGGSPFPPGSQQDRMFRRDFGGGEGQRQGAVHALGSGFVVDAEGHIVTNNHVVENATAVRVALADGRELPAKIVGRDPRTDLAVLQVDAGAPLPHLSLGDSDAARVGDWVVAMGNPFGLGGTVTAGILSARGRDIGAGPYDDFLQVDAPINSGNSGGPLFAQNGSVVGVNTAIFSPSGGSVGIGFAIPSNLVKRVVAQLEKTGHVERGFLGASTQPVTPTMAKALGLPRPGGALVAEVEEDGPAARAGLRPGDVVTAVDGTPVQDPRDLARAVAELRPGTEAGVAVRRDGREETLRATLAELRDKDPARPATPPGAEQQQDGALGIALASVTEAVREALDLPPGVHGAAVAAVRPDSPAAEAGLRPGDVVQAVGGREVATVQEAAAAIRDAERTNGGAVALRVLHGGRDAFLALQSPDKGRG